MVQMHIEIRELCWSANSPFLIWSSIKQRQLNQLPILHNFVHDIIISKISHNLWYIMSLIENIA